jgi:nickel-type superoxide dismutase maturation protease
MDAVALGLLAAAGALVAAGACLATCAVRRLVVVGESMAPTVCEGDRVLVVRAPRWLQLRPGDVVAASDPRVPSRLLIKRVAGFTATGAVHLLGDNPPCSTDSREFGAVERQTVWGLVRYRYAPAVRAGVIGRGPRR